MVSLQNHRGEGWRMVMAGFSRYDVVRASCVLMCHSNALDAYPSLVDEQRPCPVSHTLGRDCYLFLKWDFAVVVLSLVHGRSKTR